MPLLWHAYGADQRGATGSIELPQLREAHHVSEGAAPRRRSSTLADSALAELLDGEALADWLGPLDAAIAMALRGEPDADEFGLRLTALVERIPELHAAMDSSGLESVIARTMYAAAAAGMDDKAKTLAVQEAGA